MGTCLKCGETKRIEEFDVRADTGKRRTECKSCRRARQSAPLDPARTRSKRLAGTPDLLLCLRCGVLKPWTEFTKRGRNSNHLQSWCKACFSAYKAERHRTNHEREMRRIRHNQDVRRAASRALVRAYVLSHPCVDCGETDIVVLEFDHVRGTKVRDVSQMVRDGLKWEKIEQEISKCEVRCANCHRRATVARRGPTPRIEDALTRYVSATPDGHDPSTYCFEGSRSIQLSYGVIAYLRPGRGLNPRPLPS